MAATTVKQGSVLLANVSIAAGGSNTVTTNLSTFLGATIDIQVIPSGTLTLACQTIVSCSPDGTAANAIVLSNTSSGLTNGVPTTYSFQFDPTRTYVTITHNGHTGNGVNVLITQTALVTP